MKEGKPPWLNIEDRVSISKKAQKLQELIEEELKRRESGIPREHWRWAGVDKEPYVKPSLRLVDADYEVYEPQHSGGDSSPPAEKKYPWDFYFFLLTIGLAGMIGSWIIVDSVIKALRGLLP